MRVGSFEGENGEAFGEVAFGSGVVLRGDDAPVVGVDLVTYVETRDGGWGFLLKRK